MRNKGVSGRLFFPCEMIPAAICSSFLKIFIVTSNPFWKVGAIHPLEENKHNLMSRLSFYFLAYVPLTPSTGCQLKSIKLAGVSLLHIMNDVLLMTK